MYGWYAVQTANAAEAAVKREIEQHAREKATRGIRQVVVPTEPVSSVKDGQKVTVEKRTMPGYVLVQMEVGEETVRVVTTTRGVIGFAGGSRLNPVPLVQSEVERIFRHREDGQPLPRPTLNVSIGDQLGVARGPFAGCDGEVAEVNQNGGTLKLWVLIFGRKTSVEVAFDQVKLAAA